VADALNPFKVVKNDELLLIAREREKCLLQNEKKLKEQLPVASKFTISKKDRTGTLRGINSIEATIRKRP
jgi:hypothetical protein